GPDRDIPEAIRTGVRWGHEWMPGRTAWPLAPLETDADFATNPRLDGYTMTRALTSAEVHGDAVAAIQGHTLRGRQHLAAAQRLRDAHAGRHIKRHGQCRLPILAPTHAVRVAGRNIPGKRK